MQHSVGTRGGIGHCIEAHDLAASKLVANRDKDRIFVTTLLAESVIDGAVLLERIEALPPDYERIQRLSRWVSITAEDVGPE